ncbi:MAG: flavodoxin [Clostridia bacterium]|nr:flavodoxin [Clostridia bacterium]
MRKSFHMTIAALLLLAVTGCSGGNSEISDVEGTGETLAVPVSTVKHPKILVAYFSCTGNTKSAAEEIQNQSGADIFEIVPQEPYTSTDLNYSNVDCRANREMNDDSSRPAISGEIDNFSDYETIFIGYPIWWGTMPKIINTLLDAYDFSGKTIIPFCTSGGSGIGMSVSAIRAEEPNSKVLDGQRIRSTSEIKAWLEKVLE